MDEIYTEKELCALYRISELIQANNQLEALSIKGYTELVAEITKAEKELDSEQNREVVLPYLAALKEATREKISDELDHCRSLTEEYSEFTGIAPKGE